MSLVALLLAATLTQSLAPTELGPESSGAVFSPASQFLPQHLAAGSDTFLAVWLQSGPVGLAWYGSLLGSDGRPLHPVPFALSDSSRPARIRIAAAGEGYGIVRGDGERLEFAFLEKTDAAGASLQFRSLPAQDVTVEAVAWSSGRFLIVVRGNHAEWSTYLIAASDEPVRGPIPLNWRETLPLTLPPGAPRYVPPEVIPAGEAFVLKFPGEHLDRGLFVQRFSRDGDAGKRARISDHTGWIAVGSANGDVALVSADAAVLLHPDGTLEHRSVDAPGMIPAALGRLAGGYLYVAWNRSDHRDALFLQFDDELRVVRSISASLPQSRYSYDDQLAMGEAAVVVLHRYFEGSSPILAALVFDFEFHPLHVELLSVLPHHQSRPVAVADGMGAVVAWADRDASTARLLTAPLDHDGQRTGPITTLTDSGSDALGQHALGPHACATNGVDHLVVWRESDWILFVRLGPGGTPLDGEPRLLATGAFENGRVLATWTGWAWYVTYDSVTGGSRVLLTPAGAVASLQPVLLVPDVIAPSSDSFLSLWRETDPDDTLSVRLHAKLFDDNGNPFVASETVIPQCNSPRDPAWSSFQVAAAGDGANFLVVCSTDSGTVAHLVEGNPGGLRIQWSSELFFWPQRLIGALVRDWSDTGVLDVVWDGRHYLVSQRYELPDGPRVALIAVDPQGQVISRRGVALGERAAERVRIMSSTLGLSLLTTSQRSVIARAVSYRVQNAAPLPPAPPPPQNVRLAYRAEGGYVIEWDAQTATQSGFVLQAWAPHRGWQTRAIASDDARSVTIEGSVFDRPLAEHLRLIAIAEGGGSEPAHPVIPARRRSVGR